MFPSIARLSGNYFMTKFDKASVQDTCVFDNMVSYDQGKVIYPRGTIKVTKGKMEIFKFAKNSTL